MLETTEDVARLDALLRQSIARAGPFLRSSFEMPEHSLSAHQLIAYLQGVQTVALATVTARGEPRVAPIGAIFYRGKFYIPTVAEAARARHVAQRPAVSLTLFAGDGLAIIIHGAAVIVRPDVPEFAAVEQIQRESRGTSVREWGDGVYLRIEADTCYTYARDPDRYPA
ncbi:MAG TPA: pyridoxamine 5'-phosphate oxidase family protein [Ktedonobacterales bacterium]|nr:pyridoxamine 5'-phosphate oxidase family protein [Ktedonobacterales bacterium]